MHTTFGWTRLASLFRHCEWYLQGGKLALEMEETQEGNIQGERSMVIT